jgi:N4-gp56 family major capsid protein
MWLADSPSGVYRDHALSSTIRQDAYADTVITPFLRPEPGYGTRKGQSITITRMGKLSHAGTVSDQDRLPVVRPTVTTHAVTVKEWGNKCELTEFETDLTHYELEAQIKENLRDQMGITMDFMAATALKTTPIIFTPKVASQTFETDGSVVAGAADRNLNVSDVQVIRDYLRQTLKAPPYRNGRYVGCLSTRCARGIKNDPTYKDWFVYRQDQAFIKSYVASFEDVDFYETNNEDALADLSGTSTVLGEALFFGADPGFTAVVRDPELRVSPRSVDLGRIWEVGWVGTLEAGLSYVLATNARVVYVASA